VSEGSSANPEFFSYTVASRQPKAYLSLSATGSAIGQRIDSRMARRFIASSL
jgi:hypothetical protein